ncbi:MAG: hypothetical protein QM820_18925 [Minicystis sp.]
MSSRAQNAEPAPAATTFAFGLDYVIGEGADLCPHEDLLRQEVARRIGYDPFAPDAKGRPAGRMRAAIARSPKGLVATYEHVDVAGARRWIKTYEVQGRSRRACESAVEGMAVEIAVELVLLKRTRSTPPPATPDPPPRPAPHASPETVLSPSPSPSRSARPRLAIGLGAILAGGVAPAVTVGGVIHIGASFAPLGEGDPWFSFAVEGRADKPAADAHRGIETRLLSGTLVACGHRDLFRGPPVTWGVLGCVMGTVGLVHIEIASERGTLSFAGTYAAVGPRFGIEARVTALTAVRIQAEVLPTLHGIHVLTDRHREGWRTAGVSGGAGAVLLFLF